MANEKIYAKTVDVLEKSETYADRNHCKFIKNKVMFPDASLHALSIERGYTGKGTIDLNIYLTQNDKTISATKYYQDNGLDAKAKAAKNMRQSRNCS